MSARPAARGAQRSPTDRRHVTHLPRRVRRARGESPVRPAGAVTSRTARGVGGQVVALLHPLGLAVRADGIEHDLLLQGGQPGWENKLDRARAAFSSTR